MNESFADLIAKVTNSNPVTIALIQKACDLEAKIQQAIVDKVKLAALQTLRDEADAVVNDIQQHLASVDLGHLEQLLDEKFQVARLHLVTLGEQIQFEIDQIDQAGFFKKLWAKILAFFGRA